jgi:CheY-like chemotaxis protein
MSSDSPSGRSVLLVEDDPTLLGAMKMVLEWEGYEVACATNGQEALEMLRAGERPALILLDVMMPVLDGWQFREEQKRDPDLASIPVVVVSAVEGAGSLDAAGHIQKPFEVEELLETLRRREQDATFG